MHVIKLANIQAMLYQGKYNAETRDILGFVKAWQHKHLLQFQEYTQILLIILQSAYFSGKQNKNQFSYHIIQVDIAKYQFGQLFVKNIIFASMQGQKKIEKYQFSLKKLLGQGSYAMVYLGRSIQTSEPVAVKVIDKKIFSNAYNVKNIQSEIDIMKKVSHDNIVRLHDIYQTANNMYIVTEFCHDGDLLKLLQKRKKIPESEAKGFLKDIMNGAKYLHKNGIIHRDLKPANILLKNGVCKLSDFGFAKSLNSEEAVMKSIVGTPLYMSPQILKKGKYTTKSDLWSIGLIYYEMLHGRTPWPAQNEIELINGIYNKKIAFSPEISEKSKDFIKHCLEIYEEDRISWQEAFTHRLLQEEVKKVKPLDLDKIRQLVPEDKENHGSISNKAKTPTNHGRKEGKDEKSPVPFKNKEGLKERRIETQCLTPKEKLTPKGKNEKSGFKNHKSELTDKKEEKDASTVKKRIIREASQNEPNIKPDRLKYY